LKVVSESRVTWATSVPILVIERERERPLCSLLRPNVHDRQMSDAHHHLMPPTLAAGHSNAMETSNGLGSGRTQFSVITRWGIQQSRLFVQTHPPPT